MSGPGGVVWALLIASAFGFLAEIGAVTLAWLHEARVRLTLLVLELRRDGERLPDRWTHDGCNELRGRLITLQDRNASERSQRQAGA